MLNKTEIINMAREKGQIKTKDIVAKFKVSRQYISGLIKELVLEKKLIKAGSTRNAFYVLPEFASQHPEILPNVILRTFINEGLEEHDVLKELENKFPAILKLSENVKSIFVFAFSEMLNNAIEHSGSQKINVEISIQDKVLSFSISDFGIGVFRSIMQKKNLKSELEAIQDLLKGKTTTMPRSHSGEGIFFTSRAGDEFVLDSFGRQLIVNNKVKDVFLNNPTKRKVGTKVIFKIDVDSKKRLSGIFTQYTNVGEGSDYGFDKTEIKIKLYILGGVYISRSQARRVLHGLEKFKVIVFDFDKVPTAGQAFADEIFRVFHNKHPDIKLESINTNEAVQFMIDRVEK